MSANHFTAKEPVPPGVAPTQADADVSGRASSVVLFVTRRPAALTFMVDYSRRLQPDVEVRGVLPDADRLDDLEPVLAQANVLVLDVADDPDGAVEFCRAVRQRRADLPILALLCCDRLTMPWHVRSLMDLDVASFLDARVEPGQLVEELISLASRANVLHLRLHPRRHIRATDLFSRRGGRLTLEQAALVELVAAGLTNHDIGLQLHLAESTVHHRIGEMCSVLGVPNRTALAAWAGANGYYRPAHSGLEIRGYD